jgi:hypothetical protein
MSLNATNLYIQAAPIPATFVGSPNDLFAEMIKRMRILSPSGTNFIFIGDTEPTSNVGPWLKNGTQWYVWDPATKEYQPQDISASFTPSFSIGNAVPASTVPPVWLRTTKDATSANANDYGSPIRWFTFDATVGNWTSPHPVQVADSANERRLWVGSEAALWSYDGGDGTNPAVSPPTAATGAMWQVDHNFDFRFPVGAGVNPTAYSPYPASAVAVGGAGGEERHFLTPTEQAAVPDLTLSGASGPTNFSGASFHPLLQVTVNNVTVDGANLVPGTVPMTPTANATVAHNTMPPYYGVFFISRTTRQYYTP